MTWKNRDAQKWRSPAVNERQSFSVAHRSAHRDDINNAMIPQSKRATCMWASNTGCISCLTGGRSIHRRGRVPYGIVRSYTYGEMIFDCLGFDEHATSRFWQSIHIHNKGCSSLLEHPPLFHCPVICINHDWSWVALEMRDIMKITTNNVMGE